MNLRLALAAFITSSLCLCSCGNYVAPPKGQLVELEKGQEKQSPAPSDLRTVDGEKFDAAADQVITTEGLVAWRVAVAHAKQGDLTDKEWKEVRLADEAESMRQLEDLSKRYPNSSYLKMLMGQVKHHFRKDEEAAGFYEEAMTKNRHDPILTFKLANSKRDAGNKLEAMKYYREVIRIQPDFVDAKVALADCLLDLDAASKEARQLSAEVQSSNPEHPKGKELASRVAGAGKDKGE